MTTSCHTAYLLLLLVTIISCQPKAPGPDFTLEELEWLKEHPSVTLSVDNTYPPLNFEDKVGNLVGVNIDLIRLIEKRIGIEIILVGSTWDVALQRAMSHEVDGIVNATDLDERKDRLSFTQDFMADPQTLICRKDFQHDGNLQDFSQAKIAVKTNSIHFQELSDQFTSQNLIQVATVREGINLLSIGQVDAVYDDFAPVYHLITTNNLNNVTIAYIENDIKGAGLGLRNDDPLLFSVFEKTIGSIEETEVQKIKEKWFNISPQFNFTPVYLGFGVLILVIITVAVWNYTLSSMVANRTQQLKMELATRGEIQKELVEYKDQLEATVKQRTLELERINDELTATNREVISQRDKLEETISELKKTQERLIQSEKLASLGVFTAGIAHEINNPVNYITSGTNVLFDAIDDLKVNPEAIEEKLEQISYTREAIKLGIDRTVSIISSLRNYSHAGDSEFVKFNVISCINDALLLLNNAHKYHILIEKKYPEVIEIECLPGKINQVFVNIINNAIHAIQAEGVITIHAYTKRNVAYFEIADTGKGIDKENLSRIFDPFFTTKETGQGTGLGLYLVHGIIQQHRGDIHVQSSVGIGTTFSIELPIRQASDS